MKKISYIIASALAFTCAVTAVPSFPKNIAETHAVYTAPDSHSIPQNAVQAESFYNEIGEISYCKCGQVITCIPIANPETLHVTYKLNGEEFTPDNITRNMSETYDTNDKVLESHVGYESISFFPKETDKEYTLEINVAFSAIINGTDESASVEENYKFNFKVDKDGVIIPQDACITPATYQQSEIFMKKYGNYTAYDNKVIVCTPYYYDYVTNDTSAELLSESMLCEPDYDIDAGTGAIRYIDGNFANRVLTFDASKEGTYSINIRCNFGTNDDKNINIKYHVDENKNVTFQQVSKLNVPASYDEAEKFIEQYGESETDGSKVVEVIPVVKSDNFSIQIMPETDEIKPYTENTVTYYYNDNDVCKGYQVTTCTMDKNLSSDEINTERLYHITNTEYKAEENYTIRKAYFCGYLIDKETKSFKEYLTEPASFAESKVFLRKYGNFCADPNQKKVIAVLPEHYEINHEIGGTAKLLKTKYYEDDRTTFIDDNGKIIETCDLGGNKILMFDASEAGDYTIRIKETYEGCDGYISYDIDYNVDENGNITLSESSENPELPDTISSFSDADKIFRHNGGYIIKQGETLQIAVPTNFSLEVPGGGRIDYENYDAEINGNFVYPNSLELLDEKLYTDDSKRAGYRVYTYDLSPKEYEVATTDGNFTWVTSKLEGDFSITYTTSNEELSLNGETHKYIYRFNATDDIIKNTGLISNDSGDANGDGSIDIADVVTLSAFVGNPDVNTISDKAKIFCDIQSHGNGIDASDVLMIQQYIAGMIKEF